MICEEHKKKNCELCFSTNPEWSSAAHYEDLLEYLTPKRMRLLIQWVKTHKAVEAAKRRNRECSD